MSLSFETSDSSHRLQEPALIAGQATPFLGNLTNLAQVEDEEGSSCTLAELLKRAPFSPGKHTVHDSSLRLKLASVDSCYNCSPRSGTPISQNEEAIFSPNRPLSPQTDISSPRSGSPQNNLMGPDSLSSSPRQFNDSISEPARDQTSLSPPESRRALLKSTNSARPHVNLSGNNGPLKASTGSSPFREVTSNHKRFTRARSNPDNGLSDEAIACQKLSY